MAITRAVSQGAKSLQEVAYILNLDKIRTRQGNEWTFRRVSHELSKAGISLKNLVSEKLASEQYEEFYRNWSEEAFWNVIKEQGRVAERNGQWIIATETTPIRNDPVRHREHGVGSFFGWTGLKLVCRFRPASGPTPLIEVKPIETEVFKWSITPDRREEIFRLIFARFLVPSAKVAASSITLQQRRARQRAMRWR